MTTARTRGISLAWGMALVIAVGLLLTAVAKAGAGWGLSDKSVWDWMKLLVVPVALALGAWWFKREERKSEQRAALETDRRNLLATYFDRMEGLLLDRGLKGADTGAEVTEIARARTLQTLRSLDGARKGHLVYFLVDAGVLGGRGEDRGNKSAIRLSYADLSGADLANAHLEGVNLWCASFENAILKNAHLVGTNLPYAHLRGADLEGADLTNANLECAVVEPGSLRRAKSLKGAIMPDGDSHEEWLAKGEQDWTRGMPQTWTSHDSR